MLAIPNEVIVLMLLAVALIIIFREQIKQFIFKRGNVQLSMKGNVKKSIDLWNFKGEGEYSYYNLTYSKPPEIDLHSGKATVWLKGLQFPLMNVNMNENAMDSDIKTQTNAFGTQRIINCRVDAKGERRMWKHDSAPHQEAYVDDAMAIAETRIKTRLLETKELSEELEGVKFEKNRETKSKKTNSGVDDNE